MAPVSQQWLYWPFFGVLQRSNSVRIQRASVCEFPNIGAPAFAVLILEILLFGSILGAPDLETRKEVLQTACFLTLGALSTSESRELGDNKWAMVKTPYNGIM